MDDIRRTKIAKDLIELLENGVLILALQLSKSHKRREMVLDGENVLGSFPRYGRNPNLPDLKSDGF